MQCDVVQCGIVQCGIVQCGIVQCGIVQCDVVQWCPVLLGMWESAAGPAVPPDTYWSTLAGSTATKNGEVNRLGCDYI